MTRKRPRAAAAAAAAPASAPPADATPPKPKRTYDKPCAFLATWLWKRESKSDEERFDLPYDYPFAPEGAPPATLVIGQRRFGPEGFASTVWDSAIVACKYLERRSGARGLAGRRAIELGAGCGLVSAVLARLGAAVTATDLTPNLPLLRENLRANVPEGCSGGVRVAALEWGRDAAERVAAAAAHSGDQDFIVRPCPAAGSDASAAAALQEPGFDLVVATDVMYVHEAVPPLVDTLRALCGPRTEVLLAYGRNKHAEAEFAAAAARCFTTAVVPDDELDPIYQCLDVTVLRLRLRGAAPETCAPREAATAADAS